MDIRIDVDDVNDNAPTFTGPQQYTVLEQSVVGEQRETATSNPAALDLQSAGGPG